MDKIAFKIDKLTPTKKIRTIALLIFIYGFNLYNKIMPKDKRIIKYAVIAIIILGVLVYSVSIIKVLFIAVVSAAFIYLLYLILDNYL